MADGTQPIHVATSHGHASIIRSLAKAGADLNARKDSKKQATPLLSAAQLLNADTVEALVDGGADLSRQVYTPGGEVQTTLRYAHGVAMKASRARPAIGADGSQQQLAAEFAERGEKEERRRRRRKKQLLKERAAAAEAEMDRHTESRGGSRASERREASSRQRTPDSPVGHASDRQSPRARKAAQKADEATRMAGEARGERREKMHRKDRRDGSSRKEQERAGKASRSKADEGGAATSSETPSRPNTPGGRPVRLLVETESTQTDDNLLQELLRRRRVYLNEQSQLGGQESESVVKACAEAEDIFAQVSRRAREEATRSVDASTCLKAALRHSSAGQGQQQEQDGRGGDQLTVLGIPASATGAVGETAALVEQVADRGQTPPTVASPRPRVWAGSGPSADGDGGGGGGAPARKNTRGFRLR
jgi:hypothetical protein